MFGADLPIQKMPSSVAAIIDFFRNAPGLARGDFVTLDQVKAQDFQVSNMGGKLLLNPMDTLLAAGGSRTNMSGPFNSNNISKSAKVPTNFKLPSASSIFQDALNFAFPRANFSFAPPTEYKTTVINNQGGNTVNNENKVTNYSATDNFGSIYAHLASGTL